MKQNEVIPRMKASIRKGLSNRLHVGDSISTFITVKYQVNILSDKVKAKPAGWRTGGMWPAFHMPISVLLETGR